MIYGNKLRLHSFSQEVGSKMVNTFFPKETTTKIRHYVYLYIHPDTDEIFYVGQGKTNPAIRSN